MASTYNLVRSCVRMRLVLDVCFSMIKDKDVQSLKLTEAEWQFAAQMESLLAAISTVVKLAQKERDVTSSYVWILALKAKSVARAPSFQVVDITQTPDLDWTNLDKFRRVKLSVDELTDKGHTLRQRVIDELEFRFNEPSDNEVLAMALDPRTKQLKFLKAQLQRDGRDYLERAYRTLIAKMDDSTADQQAADSEVAAPRPANLDDDIEALFQVTN